MGFELSHAANMLVKPFLFQANNELWGVMLFLFVSKSYTLTIYIIFWTFPIEKNNEHKLRSETDTEVIAHLVGLELDSDPSMHLKTALAKTVAKLDGTWGLAVIAHER